MILIFAAILVTGGYNNGGCGRASYAILRLFTPDHGKVEHLSPSPESCVRCKLALPLLLTLKQAHSCDR